METFTKLFGSLLAFVNRPNVIEYIPRKELDRAEQEIEKQQRKIGRLQKENERLKQGLYQRSCHQPQSSR